MKLTDAMTIIREREAWEMVEQVQKWAEAQYAEDLCSTMKGNLTNLYREIFDDKEEE
jgi:hypothetical protein